MFRSDLPTSYTGRNGVARDLLKPVAGAPLDACAQGVLEAVAELPAHGAVHDEVDGAVKQSDGVDEVADRQVDVAEEALHGHAHDEDHTLRHLGDDVHDDDAQQHDGRAAVLVVRGATVSISLQASAPPIRLPQGLQ